MTVLAQPRKPGLLGYAYETKQTFPASTVLPDRLAMSSAAADTAGPPVQSVDRALAILELLADRGESSVTELAEELGIHKSTVSRLLATLEHRDMVEQHGVRGKYRLSFGLLHMASAVMADLDLVRFARPVCEHLSEETEETVNIAIFRDGRIINIDQIIGSSAVVSVNWTGKRTPIHCTSTGKVLLAHLPEAEQQRILASPFEALTENTITDPRLLAKQLSEIRERGYGYTVEELEIGMNAVAAPVRAHDATVVAAISVTGPAYRLSEEAIPDLGELVKRAAADISLRLGYREQASEVESG